MSMFEASEPRFAAYWYAAHREVRDTDPQFDRWVEAEGQQIANGRERLQRVSDHFEIAGRAVLDVGCQWGAMTIALAQSGGRATGVDISPELMRGARIRAEEQGVDATFVHARAERLPFDAGTFDAAVCVNVLEHVEDHRRTVGELIRVLKPGGRLYIDGPNRLSPWYFRSDPHYQMLGISVLPPRLGEFYVRRIRRYPEYKVGTFPLATSIERMLIAAGARIVTSNRHEPDRISAALPWLPANVRFNLKASFFFVAEPL